MRQELHGIFMQYGENIQTARQLRSVICTKCFDI